jgi:hypothetical protein
VSADGTLDLADAAGRLAAVTGGDALGLPVIAVGWATVDTERAVAELREHGPFEAAADEAILGARCAVGRRDAAVRLAILEPNTEGRLAATLARHDEGPAVLWIADAGTLPRHLRLSTPADGPFGRERLVLGGPLGGRHLLVVERPAGTIGR